MSIARILLLDDDPALLQALPQALQYRMFNVLVHPVGSPYAALELLRQHDYDCVVTDFLLPKMDGKAFLAEVHAHRPDVPVIVMSGHADSQHVSSLLVAGAFAFVPKPLDRELLITLVKRAVQVRHLSRAVQIQRRALAECACDAHALAETLMAEQDERQALLPFTER